MEDKTGIFMEELVKLLLEANDSPIGVPASLVREKEQEIRNVIWSCEMISRKVDKINTLWKKIVVPFGNE